MSKKRILIICGVILLIAVVITAFIFLTEPTAQSEGATKQMAMLVKVEPAEKGDFNPIIVATGTVRPVEDVMLSPLVGGQVIRRDDSFTPGGFVKKGEVLLQIDPSDYRNTLELRKSELQQAETDLDVEMGRQEVAEQDLELLGIDSLSKSQKSLVLRKPQLNSVEANLKSARASVQQAQLNLSRTTIKAPFDAHILSQNVTIGSQVSPGDDLGRLVGTDFYWIDLTVPVNKIKWLHFPSSDSEKGSPVKIMSTSAWNKDEFREGYLYKQVGALDDQTRLARVLVRVPDPLGRNSEKDKPELMIGSFVEAHMQAEEIKGFVRLNRDLIRSNNTVWVMQDGELQIREVEILLTDSKYAYISSGLEDGDSIVVTNLSTVSNGIKLRTAKDSTSGENNEMMN
ncbi:efflux RND transporter periplasmic adaptor subunit [Pontixanthobacter gangjinensis]|uniref:Efflux RND transporter periplasmic adaptor subunit n=1 Tax=Christiangramia aestuarii TaxID=1028746 RepID=A0A7K1LRS4_9FLAO|nr:efflux RND transporter periplasmic adaptor subunit [Christiangramia aestuarii]MUP43497.1 efflux RND transporter periplasmic adaptor subunit [Christiangramia aestuarii]